MGFSRISAAALLLSSTAIIFVLSDNAFSADRKINPWTGKPVNSFVMPNTRVSAENNQYNPQNDARQSGCPVYSSTPAIDIQVIAGDIPIDNTRSTRDLENERIDGTVASRNRAEYQVSGLTKGSISYERKVSFKMSSSADGTGCIWPEKISVTVKLQSTVYIANRYSPGSCEFRETYNHEIKHVNADRAILNKFIPFMRSQVGMIASVQGVRGPAPLYDLEQFKTQMYNNISQVINGVIDKMQAERSSLQNGIDSPQEYARVSASCSGF